MDYVFNARRETPRKPDANPELPPTPSKPQAMTSQDNTKASTGGGFFSAINNQIQEKKIADKAAYSSLSALKIIGHVLGGLLHHSANMTEDQIEQQSQRMLKHYANQSKALLEKLKLPDERFVYESITGSMSKIISQHYRIAGDKALETDWAKLLNDVAELDGVWAEPKQSDSYGSPEVRRSMMMMNALAPPWYQPTRNGIISIMIQSPYWSAWATSCGVALMKLSVPATSSKKNVCRRARNAPKEPPVAGRRPLGR